MRARLAGWRGWLFALLGLYALGAAAFLIAEGLIADDSPAANASATQAPTELADVASGQPNTGAQPNTEIQSNTGASSATRVDEQAATATACNDVDPAAHSVDPSLNGVHGLGFVTLDEQPAGFSGYDGCPLIVNFFASWCVPCVTEMPDFERFWQSHGANIAVLGLAANDRLSDAIATVEERGVSYPTGLDEGELFIDFGGLGMPTTVFVSRQGEILETHSGLLTLDNITDRARKHFGL